MDKKVSHGLIGEAAVYAKCWMHGIPTYFTGHLKKNFAGSDLILDTNDPRRKLWVQVKTGYPTRDHEVYLAMHREKDLTESKFTADYVVFVNLDPEVASTHTHNGELDFAAFKYYIVPRDDANRLFREALQRKAKRPKRDGTPRKLTHGEVQAPEEDVAKYLDAWELLKPSDGKRITSKDRKNTT
jgi:hypothetical protein